MNIGNILSLLWCQISVILGLTGNFYVLFATIRHKAIKLDKMSVWIIQNIAVVDISNCFFVGIPTITTLYAEGRWILGDTFCTVEFVYKYIFCIANMILINFLSLNKLIRCLFPLRNLYVSQFQRYSVSVVTAIVSLVSPMWSSYGALVDGFYVVVFSASQGMCWAEYAEDITKWQVTLELLTTALTTALPCLTLVFMNVLLVFYLDPFEIKY